LWEFLVGFDQAAERIDQLRDDCVDFLAKICSIPAIGPENLGAGEMEKYEFIRDVILSIGPDVVEEVRCPDSRVPAGVRPNLLAIFHGRDRSKTLWILSHSDVVPPGEAKLWNSDPFKPYVESGFLYGRGVEDNGQAVAASVFAAKAVKETVGFGINVGLAIVADEESGSAYGLDFVLRERPEFFGPEDLILVPDAGNADGDSIEIAEKHLLHVKFTVKGQQAHGSRPDIGRNSLRATAHMIVELDSALAERFKEQVAFFVPPVSTFEPTRKDANVPNVNTIPGEDVFYYDCRILPEVNVDKVMEVMRTVAANVDKRLGVETKVEEYLRNESPKATAQDSPVVVGLAQAIQEVYGVQARPEGIGGQTVATFFRRKGLNAAVWQRMLQMAHAPNERIAIDNLIGDTKVFAKMML
jgi:succinyl-diaminopimelate desuccinylase